MTCGSYEKKKNNRTINYDYRWAQIKPLVDRACADCHQESGFPFSGSAWRSSPAAERVKNKSMPPENSDQAKGLSNEDRQRLIDY